MFDAKGVEKTTLVSPDEAILKVLCLDIQRIVMNWTVPIRDWIWALKEFANSRLTNYKCEFEF
ncbi:MAG: hypothetical protein NPIRA01_05980 [Nitrospirales bacterium]|nr:MAG: hypothetical protein NPIRA01_05980 [Nitrospirales bacterium]